MKNKKGILRPSSFLLLTLAIALVISATWLSLADFQSAYPEVEIDPTWSSIYNSSKAVSSDVNASTQKIRNKTATMGEGGWKDVVVGGFVMLSIIPMISKLVLNGMVGLLSILIMSLSEIGVPPIIGGTIIISISIIIIFGAISVIWKFEKV